MVFRMENLQIFHLILEPVNDLTERFSGLSSALFRSMIATAIAVPVLQKMHHVVVLIDTALFAAVYFMQAHNWRNVCWILNVEAVVLYILYRVEYLKSILLLIFLTAAELHIEYVNGFLLKCFYFGVMLCLGITNDVTLVICILFAVEQYIFRYRHKSSTDIYLLLTLICCLMHYFFSEYRDVCLFIIYPNVAVWVLLKVLQ